LFLDFQKNVKNNLAKQSDHTIWLRKLGTELTNSKFIVLITHQSCELISND